MVEKYHVQPRPLDDERSSAIFYELLNTLDEQRIFFTQDDYNKLATYRLQIDDQIKNKQPVFLQLVIDTYKKRLLQADTLIDNICKTPFNFCKVLILETILPDLLQDEVKGPATISINQGNAVRSFPYSTELNSAQALTVIKQGVLPVYFTAYQKSWNNDPQKVAGNFTVTKAEMMYFPLFNGRHKRNNYSIGFSPG